MRLLLLLALMALQASGALLSSTLATGANTITTPGITTTGATLLTVVVSHDHGGAVSISDSRGNSWVLAKSQPAAGNADIDIYYAWASLSVGASHTATITGSSIYAAAAFSAFSATKTGADPLDVTNSAAIAAGVFSGQTGSITPVANNSLIVSGVVCSCPNNQPTFSVNSGLSIMQQAPEVFSSNYSLGAGYLIQSPAAAINPTWTFSAATAGTSGAAIVSFKPAPAGVTTSQAFVF
jgi:hypothetical protein